MKQVFTVLLVLMLCMTTTLAESAIDVSSLTTDELLVVFADVQKELESRIGASENNQIGQGIYVVGKDIKAGAYRFTCLETGTYEDGTQRNAFYIYQLEDDGVSQGKTLWYLFDAAQNAQATFTLSEGTIFEIWNCSGFLTEIHPAWAP